LKLPSLILVAMAASLVSATSTWAQDDLAVEFHNPPAQAKPHTWWHWMNGNITKEGITADLEAMKRIGLGGAQIFNVSESIPAGAVDYNSPQWRAMVKHAAAEADRLGLELCIHNCAGWSSSGGPWVKPEDAMQTVVVSETHAQGPVTIAKELPQPKANHDFYRDIVVLAFPTPKDDTTRVAKIKVKALYEYEYGLQPSLEPTPAAAAIKRDSIVDITARFKDGALHWDVPAGDWTILRIGYTPTGAVNAPAPTPGRGLEVDKLSRDAFDRYWAGGMGPLIKELGPLAGKSLRNVLIDSYEVGCQNWSPRFREEFTKRRGYDPLPYLPAMTGRIVESGEVTERFLWDLRRTVADLFTENYYSYFAETCRKNGLLSSVEPYDGPFECSQVARDADLVMGEFWVSGDMSRSCKLAASVAHVGGKSIVGAESYTAAPNVAGWRGHPATLKAVGDLMFTEGINRCIIHRYAHQPWLNMEPGMTMGQWGTHFERTNTWWAHGGPEWVEYLARCQYLLQQGKFVADVLYLAGEAAPNDAPYEPALKSRGFDYDSCGPDALAQASVKDGNIVLATGMTYRLLVLPDTPFMTPALLDRVAALVHAGAMVLGPMPLHSPTLKGYPADDTAVQAHAKELWREPPGADEHSLRTGQPVSGSTVDKLLFRMRVSPDATFAASDGTSASAAWIHRSLGDTDLYFVSNQRGRSVDLECSFRISGKAPELWHADTGTIEAAPVWRIEGGRTIVPLHLDPSGSVFVLFRPGNGGRHVATVRGPEEAQQRLPRIEIKAARYEATDGAGGVDVTAKAAAMVAAGATEIPATNGAFGDPTYMHAKRLHITYAIDGKETTRDVPENGTLVLIEAGPDRPAVFTLAASTRGVELRAFKVGEYAIRTSNGDDRSVKVGALPAPLELTGPWPVSFQPGRGAPDHATLTKLDSWTANAQPGIKYFSGTATYEKEFDLPSTVVGDTKSPRPLILDLGAVHEIAEVLLNGKQLPALWKPPYTVDITGIAVAGTNHLTVKVTNLWVNRLIGDEQFTEDVEWARGAPSPLKTWPDWFAPVASSADATLANRPTKERLTFTTWKHWKKDSPLMDSGLMGPVTVRAGELVTFDPGP
jgi:hypothetical protein